MKKLFFLFSFLFVSTDSFANTIIFCSETQAVTAGQACMSGSNSGPWSLTKYGSWDCDYMCGGVYSGRCNLVKNPNGSPPYYRVYLDNTANYSYQLNMGYDPANTSCIGFANDDSDCNSRLSAAGYPHDLVNYRVSGKRDCGGGNTLNYVRYTTVSGGSKVFIGSYTTGTGCASSSPATSYIWFGGWSDRASLCTMLKDNQSAANNATTAKQNPNDTTSIKEDPNTATTPAQASAASTPADTAA